MNPSNKDDPVLRTEFSSPISVLIRGVSLYLFHVEGLVFSFLEPYPRPAGVPGPHALC